MHRYTLSDEVLVCGYDFWGRSTSVLFRPVDKPGWFWQTACGERVLIDHRIAQTKKNRIVLASGSERMHVYEHLGALRYLGLDGILVVPETSWLPYDGSAALFLDACKPKFQRSGTMRFVHAAAAFLANGNRHVSYEATRTCGMTIEVGIDYPGIGAEHATYHAPHTSLQKVLRTKTQGWPPYRRYAAQIASAFGWPHADSIVWPQEHDPATTRRLFAKHRALDILGALSLVGPPGTLLAGTYYSVRGGHALDVSLLQMLGESIRLAPRERAG